MTHCTCTFVCCLFFHSQMSLPTRSPTAHLRLRVLEIFLSPQSSSTPSEATTALLLYILQKGYFRLLGKALSSVVCSFHSSMRSITK
jgi:hypothetical protein